MVTHSKSPCLLTFSVVLPCKILVYVMVGCGFFITFFGAYIFWNTHIVQPSRPDMQKNEMRPTNPNAVTENTVVKEVI